MYHKVNPFTPTMWWVSVDSFARQMEELRSYKVVTLDEYDASDEKQVVITFDGVYRNVLVHAAPIMQAHGYPFELFVVGDLVGGTNVFDSTEPAARYASLDDLRKMAEMGGRIQWHTRSHPRLEALSPGQLDRELTPDETLSSNFSGPHLRWFAYPHGVFDLEAETKVRSRFVGAVACNENADGARWRLPRVTVTDRSSFRPAKVSVIIPNYNYGAFIGEAIESVLAQTTPADEILVIDDASSDNSRSVIDAYSSDVTAIYNDENLGIVENFRKAVSVVSGDYVAFVGADNRVRCDFVSRCAAALDSATDVGVAYCDIVLFGARAGILAQSLATKEGFALERIFEDEVTGDRMYRWSMPEPTPERLASLMNQNFLHGSSMFRRKAYDDVGGYRSTEIAEDKDLFQRIVNAGWKAVHVAYPLLEYRQHSAAQANFGVGLQQALIRQAQEIRRLQRRVGELESLLAHARTGEH